MGILFGVAVAIVLVCIGVALATYGLNIVVKAYKSSKDDKK